MNQELDVSVVICAYTEDRWNLLVAAIESLQQQTLPPLEIILVVDHNRNLLVRARGNFPDVLVIENCEANGLSGARNSGVSASKGEIIAFLDDDAIAAPDWLERLRASYVDDDSIIGVGGLIEPIWLSGQPRWFPEEFNWVVGCTYRGIPAAAVQVRNLIGANMSFKRDVFEADRGFQSGMGGWTKSGLACEETVFCIRALQRHPNSKLLHEPEARVRHFVPANRTKWSCFCLRCYVEGRSKAVVSRFVGPKDGLSSERTHAFRILPWGIVRGVGDTILRRDFLGLIRAGAIVAGLMITTAGYVEGLISASLMHRSSSANEFDVAQEETL